MMFLLKKILSAFLMPMSIGLFLFVFGIYFLLIKSYKKAKIVLFLTFLWFALLSFQSISNAIIAPLENAYSSLINPPMDIKYILVLGSGHHTNNNKSINSQINMTANNRLNEGLRLYKILKKENNNVKLIVSGGKGFDINPHSLLAKRFLLTMGVNEDNIIEINNARDTKEEAIGAKKIIKSEKLILVTSASHMKRSILLFKKEGLNVIPAPTNYLSYKSKTFNSYFTSFNFYKTELAFHEYLGLLWAYMKGMI